MRFLEKLREKPEYIRKRILMVAIFIIMGVVILGWIFLLSHRFSNKQVQQAFKDDIKPLSTLGESSSFELFQED